MSFRMPVKCDEVSLPLGMTKVPLGWPFMAQGFIDFAIWAVGQAPFVDSFRAETGMAWTPGKNPLDIMIDEATGVDKAFFSAFLDWLVVNHWGEN